MMREYRSHGADYTGHLIEEEMFGEIKLEQEEKEKMKNREYQPYPVAMAFVLEHQPFDPTDPEPRFASDLHTTVAEKLELEDYERLRFFTAVGSRLDHFHGVDGFIEFQVDPEIPNKVVRVTLDITTNPQKGEKYKANIIIPVPREGLDPKDDKEDFMALVEKTATQIMEKIESVKSP